MRLGLSTNGVDRLPTAVDLFSGVGGTALGLEWAGFDLRMAADLDPPKADWLAENHPGSRVLGTVGTDGDVRRLTGRRLLSEAGLSRGGLGLLVGCPPCQGYSLQGNRDIGDVRNLLYRNWLALVKDVQPKAIGFENVPGIESIGDGRFVSDLLSELDTLGYNVRAFRANAKRFGVPQDRVRLFVLGMQGEESPPPIETDEDVGVGGAIADLPERLVVPHESESVALRYARGRPSNYARALRNYGEGRTVRNCEVTRHDRSILARIHRLEQGEADPTTHHRRLRESEPSTTLTAGTPSRTACRPIHPTKDRVLTVREAARLTSFPDWYRFPRQIAEAWCLIGNAVPPLMARGVFRPVWRKLAAS